MDFFTIAVQDISSGRKKKLEVLPVFKTAKSEDLMVRGGSFYAVWDEKAGMWSTNIFTAREIVDSALAKKAEELKDQYPDYEIHTRTLLNYNHKSWTEFQNYLRSMPDNFVFLDKKLSFANVQLGNKKDYISKKLPYVLEDGDISAWKELTDVLYAPKELEKIEWIIGSVVAGDSKDIQKFLVLYGEGGTGKGTIINIIEGMFPGYTAPFNARALGSSSNQFATEAFKNNPLIAIQHDGDLSRIEDNTELNSIISHEEMLFNEKHKPHYKGQTSCILIIGTNSPVRITDAKSGIIRRLIDANPTGTRVPGAKYERIMNQIKFEYAAIAKHCLDVYTKLGKHYYDGYQSTQMLYKTNFFFNFVEDKQDKLAANGWIQLKQAYHLYKEYIQETDSEDHSEVRIRMDKFREELKNYFMEYKEVARIDGQQIRSVYYGFRYDKLMDGTDYDKAKARNENLEPLWLNLDQDKSLLDEVLKDCPAQYARSGENEAPYKKWENVTKTLKDIDTKRVHYVNIPEEMKLITIDFDLKDAEGKKNADLNIKAACDWPPTYAEYSKGGQGIHLSYYYDGDQSRVADIYADNIEIKKTSGGNSLRRKLTACNSLPIAHLAEGTLPLKEEKAVEFDTIKDDQHLINMIKKNLKKEIVPSTRQSIDLIAGDLENFYKTGKHYDVRSLKQKIIIFAAGSTHQAEYCLKKVNEMKFHSDDVEEPKEEIEDEVEENGRMAFFDVEVFPNLFLINWKFAGEPKCKRMINPTKEDLEEFIHLKLVGFNCRRYDNHIVYARYLGYSNQELYELSKRIVSGSPDAFFSKAYDLSYTDVYDFAKTKQSLKKWEIQLGIHHQELGLPWDQPVDEKLWPKVAEYCDNDVIATEAVFNACAEDWTARKILAKLAGLNVNSTTNQLTTKIIFGWERRPQNEFEYRFMGTIDEVETYSMPWEDDEEYTLFGPNGKPVFPGYVYDHGKSTYRGEEVGEGGYVYAEPGMYWNIALLDIASMHPSSIVAEELFGPVYTKRFESILEARLLVKHREWDKARKIFDGKLAPFLEGMEKLSEEEQRQEADNLSGALKIAINSVYGLTSAKFDNPFRDKRNLDNIVAKRGALFMINLKHLVQKKGFTVAHIKTDSIKIPNATPEIIQYVMDYGKLYGYTFELESVYDRMCLVNNAVYVAHVKSGKHAGTWNTTGAQFAEPYVKKTLFTKEPIQFQDLCQTKAVTTNMYLDMNEEMAEDEHNYIFVGKAGSFCPIQPGKGGGRLVRMKEDANGVKYDSVTGAKDYRWLEAEVVRNMNLQDRIDRRYFEKLAEEAKEDISKYGDFTIFSNIDN